MKTLNLFLIFSLLSAIRGRGTTIEQGSPVDIQTLEPKFEGYFIEIGKEANLEDCKKTVLEVLGVGWKFNSVAESQTEFEVRNDAAELTNSEAWDKCYEVRSKNSLISVEPLFLAPAGDEMKASESSELNYISHRNIVVRILVLINRLYSSWRRKLSIRDELDKQDVLWALRLLKVTDAWDTFFPIGEPGEGIIIAQPDTGYTEHPEIIPNLLISEGYNFVEENETALDLLQKPIEKFMTNPGHGTLSASVAVSPRGAQEWFGNSKFVVGVSPGAKLVPLRVTFSVALKSTKNLAHAIEYSADKGFHVISISLGVGIPSRRLRRAINYAHKKGVIIVAAAGTWTPYVIYPAAYDEVVAVGGCTIERKMWIGSPRGSSLDIAAPSKDVWCARSKKKDGELEYVLQTGAGTSLATPMVAGIAALWLSYHGREKLVKKYGEEKIPFLFSHLLRKTSSTPSYWNTDWHGAGIADAYSLLSEGLPDTYEIPSESIFDDSLSLFGKIVGFDGKKEAGFAVLRSLLSNVFKTDENKFDKKWDELGQELTFHVASNRNLLEKIQESSKGGDPNSILVRLDESAHQLRETLSSVGLSERFETEIN